MKLEVARIHSSAAEKGANPEGYIHEPTDVIVYLTNREKYFASFFSYEYIQGKRKENTKSGMNLHGLYFWSKNLVVVEDCKIKTIEKIIDHLLEEGEFLEVFEKL